MLGCMKIDPHSMIDIPWREAERAQARASHHTISMLSACSTPPLRSWYCPICAGHGADYLTFSTTTLVPVCDGT